MSRWKNATALGVGLLSKEQCSTDYYVCRDGEN